MNRRLLVVSVLLVCGVAAAQNDTEAEVGAGMPGMPGMNLNVRVNNGHKRQQAVATRHEEQSGPGFRISWDTDPDGDTWFKVIAPEGQSVTVLDDINFPVATGTIPVSFRAKAKKYYQVQVRSPAGVFTKKFEAKSGMVAQLAVGGAQAPSVEPAVAASACSPESDLEQVISAINGESFSDGKLRVVGDVAQAGGFCVDQVVVLLKLFSFENDKLSALKLLAPRITDRQNKFKVYQAFDFDSSRDSAKKILK